MAAKSSREDSKHKSKFRNKEASSDRKPRDKFKNEKKATEEADTKGKSKNLVARTQPVCKGKEDEQTKPSKKSADVIVLPLNHT